MSVFAGAVAAPEDMPPVVIEPCEVAGVDSLNGLPGEAEVLDGVPLIPLPEVADEVEPGEPACELAAGKVLPVEDVDKLPADAEGFPAVVDVFPAPVEAVPLSCLFLSVNDFESDVPFCSAIIITPYC